MEITTIGLDLAKSVFQLHAVDATGAVVWRKKRRRSVLVQELAKVPPCLVGIEACATAHYWAREISALGHEVRLMPPAYVKAYLRRQKNDTADAEAICEAVRRPTMRFVAVKSAERQAVLVLHRTRELLVRQRTMLVNAIRAHCAEFGLIAAQRADLGDMRLDRGGRDAQLAGNFLVRKPGRQQLQHGGLPFGQKAGTKG